MGTFGAHLVGGGALVGAEHDGVASIIVHFGEAALDLMQQLEVVPVARKTVGCFHLQFTSSVTAVAALRLAEDTAVQVENARRETVSKR